MGILYYARNKQNIQRLRCLIFLVDFVPSGINCSRQPCFLVLAALNLRKEKEGLEYTAEWLHRMLDVTQSSCDMDIKKMAVKDPHHGT